MNLEPFVYTAQLRSFTQAARQLGVSVAAVSKAVARMEDDLGVRLLVRTSRSVSLTPEGEVWLASCEAALSALQRGHDRLQAAMDHVRGPVRVTTSPVLGGVMARVLGSLAATHPDLELSCELTDATASLAADEADIAVRLGKLTDSDLLARRVTELQWVTVASPAYLADAPPLTHPDQLGGHRCVRFLGPRGRLAPWRFAGLQVEVPRGLALGSGNAVVQAALAGVGVTQAFRFMTREAEARGRLVRVLEAWDAPGPAVNVLRRPGDDVLRVRVVADHLAEQLGALARPAAAP